MNVDAAILSSLRQNGGSPVSGAELARRLKISRTAIWARIEELRSLGYDIEASPHQGYLLKSVPDVLHADDLVSRLAEGQIIGRDVQVFQETTSTNDVVDKLARDGVKEGVAVFAESQTKGRGRLGRNWVSPSGKGLWFSVLLRPDLPPQLATKITVCSATALARAIRNQTGLAPEIKWPNDILVRGRKVVGVLTELNAEVDKVKYLVLGIGVDVNLERSDLPAELGEIATSLKIESGRHINRADLAAEILRQLDRDYALVCQGRFENIVEEWERQCTTLGKRIVINTGDRQIIGQAEALDEDGALLLRTQHGHLERIVGGDIRVEKQA